jgi:hypothetical protein
LGNAVTDIEMFAQRGYAPRDAIDGVDAIAAHVPLLLLSSSPLAILRTITLRIINSLKSCAIGSISHVFNKSLKTHPCITNGDSPPTVGFPACVIWIGAALNHGLPNVVNWLFTVPVFCSTLLLEATTRFSISALQISVYFGDYFTAIALANRRRAKCVFGIPGYDKPSKALTDERYFLGHGIGSFNVVLSGGDGDHRSRCAIMTDMA